MVLFWYPFKFKVLMVQKPSPPHAARHRPKSGNFNFQIYPHGPIPFSHSHSHSLTVCRVLAGPTQLTIFFKHNNGVIFVDHVYFMLVIVLDCLVHHGVSISGLGAETVRSFPPTWLLS